MTEGSKLETLVVNFALAKKYGLDESIIIQFFIHMISQHKRMKRNSFEGRTWNYCSRRELSAQFSFWTEKEVRARLDRLVKDGILLKRNENLHSWNKQNFYAFANEAEFGFSDSLTPSIEKPKNEEDSNNPYVGPNGPIERPDQANRVAQMGQSYTISNTLSNQDVDKSNILGKTLPLSSEKRKDIVPAAKRWKLTQDQEIIFEWLKTQNINTEDRFLCLWAKTYSVDRLCEVIDYAKKICKTNLGGLINSILFKKQVIPNANAEENKQFVEVFIKQNKWGAAQIMERYVKISMPNGYDEELPYNLSADAFQSKIESLYQIS